jgi:hypothetical protein
MNNTFKPIGYKQQLLNMISWPASRVYPYVAGAGVAGLLLAAASEPAKALNLYDGSESGNNLEINLTTTLSYTGTYRVNDPSAVLAGPANANGNDGDSNFRHGIVGNLFEVVPVLDIRDGDYGAHFSSEFFLNTPYLGTNQNNQPGTLNSFSVAKNTDFTSPTLASNGRNAELLDAFVYGAKHFGGQTVSLKVGRQTLLWGQSLFFAGNGIAAGQAPIDAITGQNEINPEAQQVYLPVGQAVLTYSPSDVLTIQGYYQFEWRPYSLEGVGSYYSPTDVLGPGGQRIIASTIPGLGNLYLFREKDLKPPSENGQFGLSVQGTLGNYDLGLFGLRYDAKTPEVYESINPPPNFINPTSNGLALGTYQAVYPRDIQIFGASVGTTILGNDGPNVGAEISGRRNMPLISGALLSSAANPGNASSNPLYAVGSTWAAQASFTYLSPGIPFDPGGVSLAGEIAFNHLISVTQNRAALAQGRQASATAFDVVMTPTYYDVLPNLTVTFPIGIEYSLLGRSEIDPTMQHGTGVFNIGVTGTYETNWIVGLTYQDYLGKADPIYNGDADRGYVALNIQHSF